MQIGSNRSIQSPEKEAYWRRHLSGQAARGGSIRGYSREHGFREPHARRRFVCEGQLPG